MFGSVYLKTFLILSHKEYKILIWYKLSYINFIIFEGMSMSYKKKVILYNIYYTAVLVSSYQFTSRKRLRRTNYEELNINKDVWMEKTRKMVDIVTYFVFPINLKQ